jgi:tetratricopeptide (TPR) repeat protein
MFDRFVLSVLSATVIFSAELCAGTPASAADDNIRKAQFYAAQAERLEKAQSYEEAVAMLERALKLDPENASLHARQSDFLFAAQDDDLAALKEIERAISINKAPRADFLIKKAVILERLKRLPEAIICANNTIAIKRIKVSNNSSFHDKKLLAYYYSQRASINKNMNNLQDAENDLTLAIKLDPEANDLYIHRAQVNSLLKRWAQVVPDAERLSKLSYRGAPVLRKREAYTLMGRAYANLKNQEKATNTYLLAVKECIDDRLILNEAYKYFASISDKKNADSVKKRLDSLDQDYVPFK